MSAQTGIANRVIAEIRQSALPVSRRELEERICPDSPTAIRDALTTLRKRNSIQQIDEGDGVPRYVAQPVNGEPIQADAVFSARDIEDSAGADPLDESGGEEKLIYPAVDAALADLSEKLSSHSRSVADKDLKIRVLEALRDLLGPEIGKVLGEVAEDLRWAA